MQPADVARLVEPSDPQVSPDGAWIAFVVTTVDLDANRYRSAVWLAPADGSQPARAATDGSERDARPRWSPGGDCVAFVRHPDERGAELWVLEPGAADATRRLTACREDIDDVAWSPDGGRIAITTRVPDEAVYGVDRDRDRAPRRVDRLVNRYDGVGWTIDRHRHLFVVDVESGDVEQVTDGPYEDAGVSWSPDGTALAFSSGRTETWDVDLRTDIHVVPIPGGPVDHLTGCGMTHDRPAWAPDGEVVAFVHGDRRSMPRHGQIGIVDRRTGEERVLTTALDRNCAPFLAGARGPVWDGESLLFQVDDAGNVPLLRLDVASGAVEVVVGGDRQVTGFDVAGGTLAVTVATATGFPDVRVVDGPDERVVASFDVPFPTTVPERFTATAPDGAEVEAWLLRPATPGPRPTLVNIHGGPFSQYGNRLLDELQVQAAAGYAVVYANPRGSSGYGEAWARAIRGPTAADDPGSGWGGVDADDVLAVVDEAARRFPDVVDGERLGVLGGSYGGYLTSWLVGQTGRFRAACSERALNNMLTFAHSSDIGVGFPASYLGASHVDDPAEYVRQSPVTYADRITTPLLILHSEDDLRCPVSQAEDLFVRLRLLDRPVELVRFPGEGHELSRTGAPRHRVTRLEIILEFFGRHLGDA